MTPSQRALEAEEEFDLFRLAEGADRLHRARAAGTLEGVTTPDFENEIAPERAHVASGLFRRCGDEEDLGGWWFFGWRFGLGCPDDAVRDGGALAAGFVGVDAVVTDGLLAFGGRWRRAAEMNSGALKISKLRLVLWWRLER